MIRINQIKLPIKHTNEMLEKAIVRKLKGEKYLEYTIAKKSIDSRKKDDIKIIYSVDIAAENEEKIIKKLKDKDILLVNEKEYIFPKVSLPESIEKPIIVGLGPAGLFCGLCLARAGFKPIIIERGENVENRQITVNKFWSGEKINPNSNVQFGEGGAGTFSDGKLNTAVKDKSGRNNAVLKTFVEFGAKEEILYLNKPHIGTDMLVDIVKNIRNEIINLGGQILFNTRLNDIIISNNKISKIQVVNTISNEEILIDCKRLVLAIGHSSRDTIKMINSHEITMEQKPFAIGLRVEHKREAINYAQYGNSEEARLLPTADYKLTYHASNGRSVYSFCMCPGGYVVNSSSEEGRMVVNGMSNHNRNGKNSNSAIVVNISPEDFQSDNILAGIEFQRKWEEKAYEAGKGLIPVQLFKDFKENKTSEKFGSIEPNMKGKYKLSNLNHCLPTYVISAIIEGINKFETNITGFSNDDTLLSGVETRTSSPVRIVRNENYQSNVIGIYPCGEGAGYAGGITSAAIDGIKVAEAIANEYIMEAGNE